MTQCQVAVTTLHQNTVSISCKQIPVISCLLDVFLFLIDMRPLIQLKTANGKLIKGFQEAIDRDSAVFSLTHEYQKGISLVRGLEEKKHSLFNGQLLLQKGQARAHIH